MGRGVRSGKPQGVLIVHGETTAFRCPPDVKRSLQTIADAEGVKLSVVIRRMLVERVSVDSGVSAAPLEQLEQLRREAADIRVQIGLLARALEMLRAQHAKGFQAVLGSFEKADRKQVDEWTEKSFPPVFWEADEC